MSAIALMVGCGDDEEPPALAAQPSAASLKSRLLPISEIPGFKSPRTFEWDNAIDLTGEGLPLPESTRPSDAVALIEKAGFQAGAGEQLNRGPVQGMLKVLKFDSAEGARRVAQYVYEQGLKQPCYAACSEQTGDLPVTGIPGAKGVRIEPADEPPKDAPPPFTAYGVGWTAEDYLYVVDAGGPPGALKEGDVIDIAHAFYKRVQ